MQYPMQDNNQNYSPPNMHQLDNNIPKDTVNKIIWLDTQIFFVCTWASEIIGYQVEDREAKQVYYYIEQPNESILTMDGELKDGCIKIYFSTDQKQVRQLLVIPNQPNYQSVLLFQTDYYVLFLKSTQLGLISVDMSENIRIDQFIVNSSFHLFLEHIDDEADQQQEQQLQEKKEEKNIEQLSEFCGLRSIHNSQDENKLIGCSMDYPYMILYNVSFYIYFIDFQNKLFIKKPRPFQHSLIKTASVKKLFSDSTIGDIVFGGYDGFIGSIRFEVQNHTYLIWNFDENKNKLCHFSRKNIQLLNEYNQQQHQSFQYEQLNKEQQQQYKDMKSNLPFSENNLYKFNVNCIDILPSIHFRENQISFISCGSEGRITLWKKPFSEVILTHPFQCISAIALNPHAYILAYAIGYDWHQGMIKQAYSPSVHIVYLHNFLR